MKYRDLFCTGVVIITMFLASPCSTAQTGLVWNGDVPLPSGHRDSVTKLILDGDALISVGEDGYLGLWNLIERRALDRFQISPYHISGAEKRPGKSQIAIAENDGFGFYRISAWDYQQKKQLFNRNFPDPVSYINYSAGGNFLIAVRAGNEGLMFIHPETGEILLSPKNLSGNISLAATGRSERSILVYTTSGSLSYWDLAEGTETGNFQAPSNLVNTLIFGNNRYLAGFDASSLVLIDLVSGAVLARERGERRCVLISGIQSSSAAGAGEFYSLDTERGILSRFNLGTSGRLEIRGRQELPSNEKFSSALVLNDRSLVLGSAGGEIWLVSSHSPPHILKTNSQVSISEIAVSGDSLAFLSGNGMGTIPLDYRDLGGGMEFTLETAAPYTRISGMDGGKKGSFLLWQGENNRDQPVIRDPDGTERKFDRLSLRQPLLEAACRGGYILFLDSGGTGRIFSDDTEQVFSFSSAGAMDADFVSEDSVILGRSAVSGNSPFLLINFKTGETVPLQYPASVGGRVYSGASGNIYGAAFSENGGLRGSSIVHLNLSNPRQSVPLAEYEGEDPFFSIWETDAILASTLGGDGASIYTENGVIPFEYSGGIPLRITGGKGCFIALDSDGIIYWHDSRTGKLLAVFRLYAEEWLLEVKGHGFLKGPVKPAS
ncbi:MAG: WD40 repeat domain-containing protein [Treponema sp.]|jgi:hypothetical protein|nr:WD40 repeat domain-containing protein [Treponema sp.]